MNPQQFINTLGPSATKDMQETGILACITIAQGCLESGYNTTELALNANNLFGMKCELSNNDWPNSSWDGSAKYTKKTKEQNPNGTEYEVIADFRKYPTWSDSIKDHSAYLAGAKKGDKLRFAGLVGETDYRKAIQIIKDGGYATDTEYVDKICNIIERYNLTQFDSGKEFTMEIKSALCTESDCYKANRTISVKGGMLHSVGCPQPDPNVFRNIWNKKGANACVHAVVGKDGVVLQCLPWTHRGWHAGGSANNNLIGIEMTEPATIKYVGGSQWIELGDGSNTKAHVLATYKHAVEFFAYIAKTYGFDPLDSNCLMSHSEGNKKGVASNHGDVEHIWNKFGLSMSKFRVDVKNAMVGVNVNFGGTVAETDTSSQEVKPLNGTLTVVYTGDDGLNVRTSPSFGDNVKEIVHKGVFTVVGISADEKWYKLKSGVFITTIPDYVTFKATTEQKESTKGTGYYRVRKSSEDANTQIGAFKNKDNAIELCKHNIGYIVLDPDFNQIYPEPNKSNVPYVVKVVVSDLRIRKGPGTTYDYYKDQGKTRYTGKGVFTIVEEVDGPGASKWGLLKYYKDRGIPGYIALDDEYIEQ